MLSPEKKHNKKALAAIRCLAVVEDRETDQCQTDRTSIVGEHQVEWQHVTDVTNFKSISVFPAVTIPVDKALWLKSEIHLFIRKPVRQNKEFERCSCERLNSLPSSEETIYPKA
jgi:hypothetical protein